MKNAQIFEVALTLGIPNLGFLNYFLVKDVGKQHLVLM
jgi:hypothetical protein